MSKRKHREQPETVYSCCGCGESLFDELLPSGASRVMSAESGTEHVCSYAAIRIRHVAPTPRLRFSYDEMRKRVAVDVAVISSQVGWESRRSVGAAIRSYPGSKVWQNEDEAEAQALRIVFAKYTGESHDSGIRCTSEIGLSAAEFKIKPSLDRLVAFAMAIEVEVHRAA